MTNTCIMLLTAKFPDLKLQGRNWAEVVGMLSAYKPKIYHLLIYWKLPTKGLLFCNTDGASKGNPGDSAYGFCVRNCEGNLIYAQEEKMGNATNFEVGAKATQMALKVCSEKGWQKVILETDSNSLMHIINEKWKYPWELLEVIEKIVGSIERKQATI